MNDVNYLSDEALERLFLSDPIVPISSLLTPDKKIERAFSLLTGKMEQALYGRLKSAIYLMSADCGAGKGEAVQSLLKDWKCKGFPGDGGAIIFVATLAEVDAYTRRAGLERADYAVFTPDETYKTYGAGRHAAQDVPVLFATHSMAGKRLHGLASFADANDFLYRGRARALRVWDESFSPADYASFELNDLRMLPGSLRGCAKADIAVIEGLLPDKADLVAGVMLDIPTTIGEVADAVFKSGKKLPERGKVAMEALAKLAGTRALVSGSHGEGWKLTGIGRPMPTDIGPLFVLDASARLSNRYDDWSAYGLDIVRLDPALIEYSPLTIHCWDKGCGKTVLRNGSERSKIYGAITALINEKVDESFLLVMAKEFSRTDTAGRSFLPDELHSGFIDPERVHVTTWGRHLGSNEFRDVANIVLLGAYEYGDGAYDAITLAGTGVTAAMPTDKERRSTRDSEFMHNVYQAVCRIRVRNRIGAVCSPANAYFIMPDSDYRRALIGHTFPGCTIETWLPALTATRQWKADLVLEKVLAALKGRSIVSFKDIRDSCGSDERSFLTKVLKQSRFLEALERHKITVKGRYFITSVTALAA